MNKIVNTIKIIWMLLFVGIIVLKKYITNEFDEFLALISLFGLLVFQVIIDVIEKSLPEDEWVKTPLQVITGWIKHMFCKKGRKS